MNRKDIYDSTSSKDQWKGIKSHYLSICLAHIVDTIQPMTMKSNDNHFSSWIKLMTNINTWHSKQHVKFAEVAFVFSSHNHTDQLSQSLKVLIKTKDIVKWTYNADHLPGILPNLFLGCKTPLVSSIWHKKMNEWVRLSQGKTPIFFLPKNKDKQYESSMLERDPRHQRKNQMEWTWGATNVRKLEVLQKNQSMQSYFWLLLTILLSKFKLWKAVYDSTCHFLKCFKYARSRKNSMWIRKIYEKSEIKSRHNCW